MLSHTLFLVNLTFHFVQPYFSNAALGIDDTTPIASTKQLGVAMDGFPIFGPLANPDDVLDECNFDATNKRYHIRTKDQVDSTLEFCNGSDEAVNWKYILGCYRGDVSASIISDSRNGQVPGDCVAIEDVTALFIREEAPLIPPTEPSSAPSAAPIPSGGICFSGDSTVIVEGKGITKMQQLEIGDMVDVGKGQFEAVYSFGHYNPYTREEFLEITANKSILRITPNHMIWEKSRGFIPASNLGKGDQLVDSAGEEVPVKSIRRAVALGAFAPFTPSGQIVVSGVVASSFIAFESQPTMTVVGIKLSYHWIAHTFEFPHRVICDSFWTCPNETYDEHGISTWVSTPFKVAHWLLKRETTLQNLLLFVCILMLSMFAVVEACLFNPLVVWVTLAAGFFVLNCRRQHSKTKVV